MKARSMVTVAFMVSVLVSTAFAGGKPDLVVEDMWFSNDQPVVDESVRVAVSVLNRGDVNASKGFTGTFYLNWRKALVLPFKADFPPDYGSIASMDFIPHSPGNYTVYFEVDAENVVDESDEENNGYVLTIQVHGREAGGEEPLGERNETKPLEVKPLNETVNGTVPGKPGGEQPVAPSPQGEATEPSQKLFPEEKVMYWGTILTALIVMAAAFVIWKKGLK